MSDIGPVRPRAGEGHLGRVALALAGGLALGLTAAYAEHPLLDGAIRWLEPVGAIWVNAIRMTVVPLVVALLIIAVARASDARRVGRAGVAAFAVFVGLLVAAAVYAMVVVAPVIGRVPVDPAAAFRLRQEVTAAAAAQPMRLPGTGEWLAGLAPTNVVRAAADGAMLPLVVFTVLFALALRRIPPARAGSVLAIVEGIGEAMLSIVRWVIAVAPIGIFCLVAPLAARLGLSIAGPIGYYIAIAALSLLGLTLVLCLLVAFAGTSPLRFVRAALPAQAVAFSSSSSLASLPALFHSAARLGLPSASSGFVLPVAVSSFKVAAPVTWTVGTVFLARLYGVELGTAALLTVVATSVVTSFATPGVPNGGFLLLAPVVASVGLPAGGVALLIALDAIPDLFATVTNVTGDLTASALVARVDSKVSAGDQRSPEAMPAAEPAS